MNERIIKESRLSPLLKWAGGKEQELKYIHQCLPKKINNYYEPFVGGGAVYFSINADKMYINDKSHELINLYKAVAMQDIRFFNIVEEMIHNWKLLVDIIATNTKDFKNKYKQYSANDTDDNEIRNWITWFVLKHNKDFNGMFDVNFNVDIDNFLKEIRKNINNKMKRMKQIENEKGVLSDKDIIDNIESALKSAFYIHFRYLYNNIKKYKIEHSFAVAIFFFIRNLALSK